MKIAFVTAVWKRPEVFAMFSEGVKVLQKHFAGRLEIIVCVAGSEGRKSQSMVTQHPGFYYCEHINKPLGAKMNAALKLAKSHKPVYCLMLGSDDIIGVNLMEEYYNQMVKGTDYTCLMDCFFFDTTTKQGLYWGGYKKFERPAGIGRLLSCRVLDKLKWFAWPIDIKRGLDLACDVRLSRLNIRPYKIWLLKSKLFALDIKSSENMNPFALWKNSSYVNGKALLHENLPEHLATMIYGKSVLR